MRIPARFIGRIWLIAFTLIAATAFWRYGSDLSTHLAKLQQASVVSVLELLTLQVAFWSILALAWRLILRTLGARDTPFVVCFWQQMLVMLGKYVPGKIWGMVARGGEMKRRGDRFSQVVTATSLEQLLLLHSGIVVAALILPLLFPSVETGILASIAVLTIPIAARFSSAGLRILGAFAHRLDRNIPEPSEVRVATGRYAIMVATYASLWIISGAVFVTLYAIFVEPHFTADIFFVLMLSNVAGIAAGFLALFAPGGIGVREGVTIGLLLPYIPVEHAMVLAIAARLWQVVSDVLGGALGLWLARHLRDPN